MPNSAIDMDAGMPSTTTNAPRSEPKNSAKTSVTTSAPSIKLRVTAPKVRPRNSERS